MVDEALYFFKKDVGKKVYEMEYEITYVTKWQILAEDKDQAFNICHLVTYVISYSISYTFLPTSCSK